MPINDMTSRATEAPRGPRWWLRLVLGGLAVTAVVAAGCGDDDDEDAGSDTTVSDDAAADGASSDTGAYCDATLAIETAGEPDIDFSTATDEEITAATKDFAAETLRPLADDVLAVAPAEVQADIQIQSDALDEMAETGDFAVFETPEVVAAEAATHEFDLGECGWNSLAVDAADYSFAGLPDEVDAGVTSFELTNGGAEVHEMILIRKNDGVTQSFDELLALPEDQAMQSVTMVGLAGPVPPGQPAYAVADLEAGEYIAVCFIPVGTVSFDGPPPEGPPHVMQGMQHQFTVS